MCFLNTCCMNLIEKLRHQNLKISFNCFYPKVRCSKSRCQANCGRSWTYLDRAKFLSGRLHSQAQLSGVQQNGAKTGMGKFVFLP